MNIIRRYISFVFLVFFATQLQAQRNEIGVFLGGANPISDVGREFYVLPNQGAFGLYYRRNEHTRFSYRIGIYKMNLLGDDAQSRTEGKRLRNFRYNNDVLEVSAGVDFHFFKFNLKRPFERPVTPYIYTGISYFWYDNLYYDPNSGTTAIHSGDRYGSLAIPIGLGVKMRVSSQIIVGVEALGRYSFTNNLDGGTPVNSEHLKVGNQNSKDGFTTIGFTLTYAFGEYPCNHCYK